MLAELPAVAQAALAAGLIDQDAPHGLGSGGEEVAAALPGPLRAPADQPQVGLLHQRRGLERLAGLLLGELPGRELAQLVVDQGQELLGRLAVALLDRREDAGHVIHGREPPGP
jgi:hypothetical protein